MLLIAYQGIYDGTNFEGANTPNQYGTAFNKGFSVMADVWYVDGNIYVGTDQPLIQVTPQYIQGNRWWLNAKNSDMYTYLQSQPAKLYPHFFTIPAGAPPSYVVTSDGHNWVFGTVPMDNNSVVVLPEVTDRGLLSTVHINNYAICSVYCTFISRIRNQGIPFYGDINVPF